MSAVTVGSDVGSECGQLCAATLGSGVCSDWAVVYAVNVGSCGHSHFGQWCMQ